MNKKIAIIGAGGHGKVVGEIALLNDYKVINFFDENYNSINNFPFSVINCLDHLLNHLKDYDSFFVAIGDNQTRGKLNELLKKLNVNIVSLIHPNSIISKFSVIGKGTCIMANTVVNPGAIINDGVIINTSSSVDHDCFIDDFSHMSPNCALSGGVNVGKFTHLGTGTSVHPGISIGNNVQTGVGSNIYKDIKDGMIVKN